MAIQSDSLLSEIQSDFYNALLSDAFLAAVPILQRNEDGIDNQIENALKGMIKRTGQTKSGGFIAVHSVDIIETSGDTPMPLVNIAVTLECSENAVKNRHATLGTGITAQQMAARVVQIFHGSHFENTGTGIRLDRTTTLPLPIGEVGYEVRFRIDRACFDTIDNVNPVAISEAAGEITLSTTTAGATIYYTTDGSYPGSGNATASTYSAPVTLDAGTYVRAGAEKADMNAAKFIASHTVTG